MLPKQTEENNNNKKKTNIFENGKHEEFVTFIGILIVIKICFEKPFSFAFRFQVRKEQ